MSVYVKYLLLGIISIEKDAFPSKPDIQQYFGPEEIIPFSNE